MIIVWILVGFIGLCILWLIVTYNGLVSLRNRTKEAWSDIDVQLKRRYDLIPNLVESVRGYAKHEKDVFKEVTLARAEAMKAKGMSAKSEKEDALSDALKSVFAIAENYPQLRANENFLQLQTALTETEDKLEAARRFYNGNVREINTQIEIFPNNLISNSLGFKKMELFEAKSGEKEKVEVKF